MSTSPSPSDDFVADPIVVEVERGGFVESVHHGRAVVTAADGSVLASVGSVAAPMYARSSLKPLQAVGLLRAGLDLSEELLAISCASHAGEDFHLAAVTEILQLSGLDPTALQTPPDRPTDQAALHAWIRSGRDPEPLAFNCSGKHAAMIRTAVLGGHPLHSYRDADHPVQRSVRQAIEDLTGDPVSAQTVDGCGAPLWATSLTGLARAFGRIAAATDGPEAAVAAAVRRHPEYVSGTTRDELALLRALPGLIAKAGAEAVYAVGLPDGRGVAVKISDGGTRARTVLMATILRLIGLRHPVLDAQAAEPVLAHGQPFGAVRTTSRTVDTLRSGLA